MADKQELTMETVTVTLNVKEFEYVINALAQRPFAEVNALLQNLVQQANQQKAAAETPPSQ
jgi:hypothetical protein